jgi:hypothetical protein
MSGMSPRLIFSGHKIDAIFVWGRAEDEWQSTPFDDGVLSLAAQLHRLSGAPVVIPGYCGVDHGQGLTGYPGPRVWRDALALLGVPDHKVKVLTGSGCNTRTEMDDFLNWFVENGGETAMAVTQQPHALRAMLGTVKSLSERNLSHCVIVPMWPYLFDWNRACYGSQGEGRYPRIQWIDEEFDRIPRYQKTGDLATLEQLFEYLSRLYRQVVDLT